MRRGDRPQRNEPGQNEPRQWRWVTAIGSVFMVSCTAMLLAPSDTNPFRLAGGAVFGAACAGVGIAQLRARRHGAGSKPSHRALACGALLLGLACLLIAVGSINGDAADFSARYPRGLGIAAGLAGAVFFGAAGIYGLVKGPRH